MTSVIKNYFRHGSLLALVLLLAACSSSPQQAEIKTVTNAGNKTLTKSESKEAKGHHSDSAKSSDQDMSPEDLLYVLLRNEYTHWVGSPYKYGGNTLNGIDCSSLVQQVFENSFNIDLPRTTEYQVKKGISIKKSELEVGDLVFFKTGRRTRHVGIYMGDDEFFHVSTSQGTKISSLSNVYWKRHYWQSRRIID